MIYEFNHTTRAISKFIKEEYFPVIVEFDSEELNNRFIEFDFQDTDMLELAVNPHTKLLKRVTLTLCNHYRFLSESLIIPDYDEGMMAIIGPDSTECPCFLANIYTDGVKIDLSEARATKYYKVGNIVFAFSDDDVLASVYIIGLSNEEVIHIKTELEQN